MKKLFLSLLGMAFTILTQNIYAQCALEPISLDQRIDHADWIVEAEVVEQKGFISLVDQHVYTANYLKIYKVFNGQSTRDQIVLVTPGGYFEGQGEVVTPSLQLRVGSIGMFFLNEFEEEYEGMKTFKGYSGPQACVFYNVYNNQAQDVFSKYTSIEGEIYSVVQNRIGKEYSILNKRPAVDNKPIEKASAKPIISSIFPTSVAAGINQELEIRGENFGPKKGFGKILFANASTGDPFVEPVSSQIKWWSDSLIKLHVPSGAGSGALRLEQDGIAIFLGLEVRFARLNFSQSNPIPTTMVDDNGNGGFTYEMTNGFAANSAAKASLVRALASWSDNTCINWNNGSTTSTDRDMLDGVNSIRFGASGELPNGVLAHTRSYYTQCDTKSAYTKEIDLTFDPDRKWNYGSGSPFGDEYDIESVAVHELGHAHQLGHVINTSDFMHATVGTGVKKRTLSDFNIEAGISVMKASAAPNNCNPDPMTPKSNCELYLSSGTELIEHSVQVFPNPFNNRLHINLGSMLEAKIQITDVQGRLVFEKHTEGVQEIIWDAPSSLNNGLYLVTISGQEGISHSKVLLER